MNKPIYVFFSDNGNVQFFTQSKDRADRFAFDNDQRAVVYTAQPPQDERGEADCGNAECGWRGPISECAYLGGIGPCCPKCREIVEPDAEPTQPVALTLTVTDTMVDAYLLANKTYWEETDELPGRPDKWRNGTPKEATRMSLEAALAASAPAQQSESLRMEEDAVDALFEDGWVWDGDQWQRPPEKSTPPQPVAAEVADTHRLDWLMHRLSGAELRRIGVEMSSGSAEWVRLAIDEAMAGTGSDESKKGEV